MPHDSQSHLIFSLFLIRIFICSNSEFLTGFHKRKLAKTEAARKKAIEREKQQRQEDRREVGAYPTLHQANLSLFYSKDACSESVP